MTNKTRMALDNLQSALNGLAQSVTDDTAGYTAKQAWELGLLALTVWREARGEGFAGMLAVAWSIRNRATQTRWWGSGWVEVLLRRTQIKNQATGTMIDVYQYSANNPADANGKLLPFPGDKSWDDALKAAEWAYTGNGNNPIGGATHYYAKTIAAPNWTTAQGSSFVTEVGNHRFFIAN